MSEEAKHNLKVPIVMNTTTVCLLGLFKIQLYLKLIIQPIIF